MTDPDRCGEAIGSDNDPRTIRKELSKWK